MAQSSGYTDLVSVLFLGVSSLSWTWLSWGYILRGSRKVLQKLMSMKCHTWGRPLSRRSLLILCYVPVNVFCVTLERLTMMYCCLWVLTREQNRMLLSLQCFECVGKGTGEEKGSPRLVFLWKLNCVIASGLLQYAILVTIQNDFKLFFFPKHFIYSRGSEREKPSAGSLTRQLQWLELGWVQSQELGIHSSCPPREVGTQVLEPLLLLRYVYDIYFLGSCLLVKKK